MSGSVIREAIRESVAPPDFTPMLHRSPPGATHSFCSLRIPESAPRYRRGTAPAYQECVVCAELCAQWLRGGAV